jgi:hypothetical protein
MKWKESKIRNKSKQHCCLANKIVKMSRNAHFNKQLGLLGGSVYLSFFVKYIKSGRQIIILLFVVYDLGQE